MSFAVVGEVIDGRYELQELVGVGGMSNVYRARDLLLERMVDVKPQNVLLNGDGRAKVTDFGIARVMDVDGMTTTGAVVGTSHYMAPEQAKGELVDAQSDVYGLGAVLYELLSGDVPFPGDNFVTVAMRH